MRKTASALILAGAVTFSTAASCQDGQKPTEWYHTELGDCDADDRSPHWEVKDCGPSPRPMQTAYQPAPSKKPVPKKTRR